MITPLENALMAIKNGERDKARFILADILRSSPKHEMAWYWLSTCVDTVQQQKDCLTRVIAINPNNTQAKAALWKLEHDQLEPKDKVVSPLREENQTVSESINAGKQSGFTGNIRPIRAEKSSVTQLPFWIGVLVLAMFACWILLIVTNMAVGTNTRTDLPVSDPTQFKRAAGKYQLVEVFAYW